MGQRCIHDGAFYRRLANDSSDATGVFAMDYVKSPALTKTIIIGVSAVLAGAVFFAVVGTPRSASALPAYSQKEGKPCGYCHVNPAGGGPRNAKGKQYEANGHKF
jgi:hypothetical protein